MEEKKAKVLQQLQQMKDVSKQHIEDGNPFFVMHANCAIEFADLAMELLNAGANLKEGEEEEEEPYEDPDPDAHTHDYDEYGECKICGAIQYKSCLWFELYGGEP